jgi:hypothetical protein
MVSRVLWPQYGLLALVLALASGDPHWRGNPAIKRLRGCRERSGPPPPPRKLDAAVQPAPPDHLPATPPCPAGGRGSELAICMGPITSELPNARPRAPGPFARATPARTPPPPLSTHRPQPDLATANTPLPAPARRPRVRPGRPGRLGARGGQHVVGVWRHPPSNGARRAANIASALTTAAAPLGAGVAPAVILSNPFS